MRRCDVHDVPLRDDQPVCLRCRRRFEHDLAAIGWLSGELDVTLSRQRGVRYGGARPSEMPLPFDKLASDVADDLRATLVGWVREFVTDTDRWPADTVAAMAGWLLRRVDRIVNHPAWDEALDEIGAITGRARRAIDRHDTRLFIGKCWADVDGQTCEADLYARPDAAEVTCKTCGGHWDVADRREWLLHEAEGMLAHAAEIGRAAPLLGVDVTPAAIRGYAARGRVVAHGTDPAGRPLYRVGDVLEVARDVAARRSSRRAS